MIGPKDKTAFMYLWLIHKDDYRYEIEERWKSYLTKSAYVLMYEPSKIKIMYIHKL